MNNDIIKFLNINTDQVEVVKIEITDTAKYITIRAIKSDMYCPQCNFRMHSKGLRTRKLNYPMLQDGYKLILILEYRRFKCSNPNCDCTYNEEFNFAMPYKHNVNMVPYMILKDMKNINNSAADVAKKYYVSDTYVHNIIMEYLDPKRLPLPEILAVDEVHLDYDDKNKYSMVLMDFSKGILIDVLSNRLKVDYDEYFKSIPLEERNKVKILVCDMYNPYVNFTKVYFKNAAAIVDSFHVIQWINNKINNYINTLKKKFQERDRNLYYSDGFNIGHDFKNHKPSFEVFMLTNFRWVLLSNKDKIYYSTYKKYYSQIDMYLDTYSIEYMFLNIDSKFRRIRELKEAYIQFNSSFPMERLKAEAKIDELIRMYEISQIQMFVEFSELLKKFKREIINSLIDPNTLLDDNYVNTLEGTKKELIRRISNGPVESYNRKPKDLKRNSRGFKNIEYTRNRLLWANRPDEPVLNIPKKEKEIHNHTGKKRGPYQKKNK